MTMDAALDAQVNPDQAFPIPSDPVLAQEQEVRYSYWPVAYQFGDPTVISNVSLPLSGVQFSQSMRGVGEFRATIQLADPEVIATYPWDKVIPRKTGIVVVREVFNRAVAEWSSEVVQHYVIWQAPRNAHDGRMTIYGTTVEGLWARRLITEAMSWTNVDQATIAADLLDPVKFSQIALGLGMWRGWINVDPPTATGFARTFSYAEGQETNLLEAQQNRSQLATNSYEWTTRPRVLSGADAMSANTFRLEFQLGYPRLGREIGGLFPVPRVRFDRRGDSGAVSSFEMNYDGSNVPNIVWARGKGYDELQVKAVVTNTFSDGSAEWDYGYLQTEDKFSDPDVSVLSTLQSYARRYMWEKLGSEQFVSALTLKGNAYPHFGTYEIGDDIIFETNDLTWPPDYYDSSGYMELALRIFGWKVTPPQGEQNETVELVLSGEALT